MDQTILSSENIRHAVDNIRAGTNVHATMRPLAAAYLCPFLALTVACGEGLGDPTGSTCPSDSTLTYASFGQAFIQSRCLSCHTSTESPTLTTLEQIRANSSEIDRAAAAGPDAVNTYMPENGSVSEAERRQLGEWLACGAPE